MVAVNKVPVTVARGIVRSGSRTWSAGIVADSRPVSAQSVSVAVAVTAARDDDPLALKGTKLLVSRKNKPTMPMAMSGTSLRTVVASWTRPASRTPSALTPVRIQMAASATLAAAAGVSANGGQRKPR